MHQRKRKGEDSPESRRLKRPQSGYSHVMDWGHPPANYDSPQRMHRVAGHLPPRAVGGSPMSRPSGKISKSHGSPLGRSDKVCSSAAISSCQLSGHQTCVSCDCPTWHLDWWLAEALALVAVACWPGIHLCTCTSINTRVLSMPYLLLGSETVMYPVCSVAS